MRQMPGMFACPPEPDGSARVAKGRERLRCARLVGPVRRMGTSSAKAALRLDLCGPAAVLLNAANGLAYPYGEVDVPIVGLLLGCPLGLLRSFSPGAVRPHCRPTVYEGWYSFWQPPGVYCAEREIALPVLARGVPEPMPQPNPEADEVVGPDVEASNEFVAPSEDLVGTHGLKAEAESLACTPMHRLETARCQACHIAKAQRKPARRRLGLGPRPDAFGC